MMMKTQEAGLQLTQQNENPPTVLIVDDTPSNLETLHRYFQSLGFGIMMARSGATAIQRVEYIKPDIILLDILMPGMDGFETCLRFKSKEETKHIPIIFMTALDDTVHKVKGFQVGAADYITKPFQIEEVYARVQTHLELRDLQSKLEHQNDRLQIEIKERQETAKALRIANEEQEIRVQRRTAELAKANIQLVAEISERRLAEIETRKLAAELALNVESRTNELATIYQVTALAGESLDLQTILNRALESILDVAQSKKGAIHLVNEEFELAAFLGFKTSEEARRFADDKACAIIADPQPSSIQSNLHLSDSYYGVPIRVGDHILGALSIFIHNNHPNIADPNLPTLLTAIADHLGIVVESIRLRRRAARAAILEERSRLARELHDSVTQLMYSVNLFARAGKDAYRLKNLDQGEKNLNRLEDTSRQALKELRLLLFELRPPELEQEGLIGALQHRLDAVEGRSGVSTQLLVNGEQEIPQEYEEALYALSKEALNNTIKHAKATSVTIYLKADSDIISLTVVDNGIGFHPKSIQSRGGIGLSTMNERAAGLGGQLEINSAQGQGTSIKLTLVNPSV